MNAPRSIVIAVVVAASSCEERQPKAESTQQGIPETKTATPEQTAEIRQLIEQLVFESAPNEKKPLAEPEAASADDPIYRKRFETCEAAFAKLTGFKELAFPYLLEHLDDKRQSIPFKNHSQGSSVGDACYWNLHFQLQDRPPDYSSYGYGRQGKDGEFHPKPYWKGSPFEEAGGLKKWLELNRQLSYPQKQIKCLSWLLDHERAIGASDAECYFRDILPLEVRILERRLEAGEKVEADLERKREELSKKSPATVPPELLPSK